MNAKTCWVSKLISAIILIAFAGCGPATDESRSEASTKEDRDDVQKQSLPLKASTQTTKTSQSASTPGVAGGIGQLDGQNRKEVDFSTLEPLRDRRYPVYKPPQVSLDKRTELKPEYSKQDLDGVDAYSQEWFEMHQTVIAPWVFKVDKKIAGDAKIYGNAVSFPNEYLDTLERLERMDVIVTGHREKPFLRRVVRLYKTSKKLIVKTDRANLTDAFLKLNTNINEAEDTEQVGLPAGGAQKSRQQMLQTRRQRSQPSNEFGHPQIKYKKFPKNGPATPAEDQNIDFTWNNPFSGVSRIDRYLFSGPLEFETELDFSFRLASWMDLEIDLSNWFEKQPEDGWFESTRPCENPYDDCFVGTHNGMSYSEDHPPGDYAEYSYPSESCPNNTCAYKNYAGEGEDVTMSRGLEDDRTGHEGGHFSCCPDDSTKDCCDWGDETAYSGCEDLVEAMDVNHPTATEPENKTCGKGWLKWQTFPNNYPRFPYACSHGVNEFSPFPAQLEWAKNKCGGSLKKFEFDVRSDITALMKQFRFKVGHSNETEKSRGRRNKGRLSITIKLYKQLKKLNFPGAKTLTEALDWLERLKVTYTIPAGYVPVIITISPKPFMPLKFGFKGAIEIIGTGSDQQIGLEGKDIGGGIHYYDYSAEELEDATTRFGENDGELGTNSGLGSEESFELYEPQINTEELKFDGFASQNLGASVKFLLYDAVGISVVPISLYTSLTGRLQEIAEDIFNNESTEECQVETKVGGRGLVGVNAELPFDIIDASVGQKWTLYDTCSTSPILNPSNNKWCKAGSLCTTKCWYGTCPEGTAGHESSLEPPLDIEENEGQEGEKESDSVDNGEKIQIEPVETTQPVGEVELQTDNKEPDNKEPAGTSSSSNSSSAQSGGGCSTHGRQGQPTIPYSVLLGILCLGLRRRWGESTSWLP